MKKKILGVALASAFIIGAFAACDQTPAQPAVPQAPAQEASGQPTPEAPPVGAELGRGLIVATQNEPPSVAPGQHNAVAGTYMNVMHYNGLFRLCADTLNSVPDLVESYIAYSDTVFYFTLHEGVQFHDGTILTAHDVAASWEFVRQFPQGAASRASIVSWEVIDDLTIRVDTDEPNAMLFQDLNHNGNMVMPAALIEAGNDFETNVVGTGPFIFDNWRSGDSIHSYANPNYFNPERAARVEFVTWRVIPEGPSRTIALEMGEADFNVYVAPADVARLRDHANIDMEMYAGTVHSALLMNNDLDMFSDYRVRRALSMAVDIDAVILVGMEGLRFPTHAQIPTIFPGFDPYVGIHEHDPQGALALLAEAGVAPSDITFSMIASNDERRRMGEVVQANLAEIGIHVEVEMNDLATTLERTQQGDFETGFGGFSSSTLLGYVRGVLHSSQAVPGGSNRSNFQNAELDYWIDLGLRTVDPAARPAIYQEIARIANTYTPHIPMYMGSHLRAWNSNLVVPERSATGALNLEMMFWSN